MTIDDPAMAERTFTETHDRILHALVEQVHDMGRRLAALEAANEETDTSPSATLAPPAIPSAPAPRTSTAQQERSRHLDRPARTVRPRRPAGWQPTRR